VEVLCTTRLLWDHASTLLVSEWPPPLRAATTLHTNLIVRHAEHYVELYRHLMMLLYPVRLVGTLQHMKTPTTVLELSDMRGDRAHGETCGTWRTQAKPPPYLRSNSMTIWLWGMGDEKQAQPALFQVMVR
jgi:hypothetical protein